jgi:hypothetical protein
MSNYLISLARRGAGLVAEQSPNPSSAPNFSAELGGTRSDTANSVPEEFESVSTRREMSESRQETPEPFSTDASHLAAQTVHVTSPIKMREHFENGVAPSSDSVSAPAESSSESSSLEMKTRVAETPLPVVLPDAVGSSERLAQGEHFVSAPVPLRQAPLSPASVEMPGKDKALADDLSLITKSDEALRLLPETHQSVFMPSGADSSTSRANESHPVKEGAQVIPQPQILGTSFKGSGVIEAALEEKEPRIEVSIGRVEVRFTQAPPAPAPRQSSRPRGFNEYALARRYLDRKWY